MLYQDRQDWADVTPVPQSDGTNPACPIAYTPECQLHAAWPPVTFAHAARGVGRAAGGGLAA